MTLSEEMKDVSGSRRRILEALINRPRTLAELSRNLGFDEATIRSAIADLEKGKPRRPRVFVNDEGQLYVEGGPVRPVPPTNWTQGR